MSAISSRVSAALKIAAVLWVVWGLGHVAAGVMIIDANATSAVQLAADAVDPAKLEADYPAAADAIINQHGWNLLWGGAVTAIGALFVWRHNATAVFLNALVGGMLDVGYLVFVDLPGYANFVPGTMMTLVSGSAIFLSVYAYLGSGGLDDRHAETAR